MVSGASAPLTTIGFRRDVKLFLGGLTGFLVLLVLLLLMFLRTSMGRTEDALDAAQHNVANAAVDAINTGSRDSLGALLTFIRGRYNVDAASIDLPGGTIRSGSPSPDDEELRQITAFGLLHLYFDATPRRLMRTRYYATAAISVAAASIGVMLMLLYVPRIVSPIEKMLDQAKELGERGADQEETAYLIDTFRHSIDTLKSQEQELKRLHDAEKTRADDLERVTAALTRSLTSGLIAIDRDGDIVDVNAAGREILGIDPHAPLGGRAVTDVVTVPAFADALGRAFAQQSPMTRIEIEGQRGADAITIGLTTVPLRNESGAFLGLLALFTDLTHIRGLEARVQEMTTLAQLGEISAGIAHELRNSVNTILGYMKLARRGGIDAAAEGRLQSAEKEASLLLQAVERLLAFARPIRLNTEPLDLREIVSDQVRQLGEVAPGIDISISGPPVEIEGDRVLLSRAIENLLRNAADAVRAKDGGGAIRVTLADQPSPSITIADNGIGFDPAETARLFLPFHSNKPTGFGMGLPLAKKIVLMHGGTLKLHGAPGAGAVATIEFGAADAAP